MNILLLIPFIFFASCQWTSSTSTSTSTSTSGPNPGESSEAVIYGGDNFSQSTPAGNLVASALKEIHQLDFVFYPAPLLSGKKALQLDEKSLLENAKAISELYPSGTPDQFLIGALKGKDIKQFIYERLNSTYQAELEVAGLLYYATFTGGVVSSYQVLKDRGQKIEDEENYQVAISRSFYFSSNTFPGYLFGNGMNHRFASTGKIVSAQDAVFEYLVRFRHDLVPDLNQIRSQVMKANLGNLGKVKISQIQGRAHRSPMLGFQVTTRGVVTGIGDIEWYPHGREVVIQDPQADEDPKTSEGIMVYLTEEQGEEPIEMGDLVEVSGTVYERTYQEGLSITCLRDLSQIKRIDLNQKLPAPIKIGLGAEAEVQIPSNIFSSYQGNLNEKNDLNLQEGIDFWESLENMRVSINNPRIVGFSGGRQELVATQKAKGYLTFYVLANGDRPTCCDSDVGGIIPDFSTNNFHPQILPVSTGPLSWGISTEIIAQVGDILWGEMEGIIYYDRNIFGGGNYNLVLPQGSKILQNYLGSQQLKPLEERAKTNLVSDFKSLTFASFNVENLAANNKFRLKEVAKVIQHNLQCPDLINFVEIQDQNGEDFSGGTGADLTLQKLKSYINCPEVSYQFLNLHPQANADGGAPGGNIQLAIFYNQNKLNFQPRPAPANRDELQVGPNGTLSANPGKLFSYDRVFRAIRKSLVAEFNFRGERIFVIGNHFNSKLGDDSWWAAERPIRFNSELRRGEVAAKINNFLLKLAKSAPHAHLVVLGDFNAYSGELSMGILGQGLLVNLMTYQDLVSINSRYTTNYLGNSGPIDHLFVGRSLLEKRPQMEILHINSNYMGQISDHDPIIAKFQF